jgi:hypothetical protein
MKVSVLLTLGAFSALAGVVASGQAQPPPAPDLQLNTKAMVSAPRDLARTREVTPPAPRGDLRGDIASNVRARPDGEREDRPAHH